MYLDIKLTLKAYSILELDESVWFENNLIYCVSHPWKFRKQYFELWVESDDLDMCQVPIFWGGFWSITMRQLLPMWGLGAKRPKKFKSEQKELELSKLHHSICLMSWSFWCGRTSKSDEKWQIYGHLKFVQKCRPGPFWTNNW